MYIYTNSHAHTVSQNKGVALTEQVNMPFLRSQQIVSMNHISVADHDTLFNIYLPLCHSKWKRAFCFLQKTESYTGLEGHEVIKL